MSGEPLLTPRERVIWAVCFLAIAAILVLSHFTSTDGDSALYADLSTKLTAQPVARWVAPEWWGLWPEAKQTGYFREHPAGLFWIPAALGRLGVPPIQAAYIFGIAAGLASLLLAGWLVMRVTTRADGRAALVLLQLMPLAFIFRVRDNHEYPMLVCLLAVIAGLDGVSRSWRWIALVMIGVSAGLLVKGVFVAVVLIAAALWIAINPTHGSRARQLVAMAIALVTMLLVAYGYDWWYVRVTGGPFWRAYWARQLGPMTIATPLGQARMFAQHIGFYLLRLLFHPAPWSVTLVWAAWRLSPRAAHDGERRGLIFTGLFAMACVVLLAAASRSAERYAFSASYVIGAAGSVVAYRCWPVVRNVMRTLDAAVPAPAALTWAALILLRLLIGPLLPRIS